MSKQDRQENIGALGSRQTGEYWGIRFMSKQDRQENIGALGL